MTRAPFPSSRVLAVLGPTNTGKTHFAVERLLAHRSGMMGFPLRLLAREIYDRIVTLRGKAAVALLTGEEKLGSDDAPYIVATVEAMPMQREVAFLAVDEIQLCGDLERGHIFTDRLLNARGTEETMFLGSDTIRPHIRRLVPEAEIVTRPRFSILSHAGQTKLHRLPRRSAVVAFTAQDVYTLAEIVRRQRGGAGVVLGALSPRTRNAQVELYQSGEVDHLVATDAIGMGLNMDLGHVAFAQLEKFDGRQKRRLTAPEIAQIAGRAGRHMADGTFGTTNGCGMLDDRVVEAVESHSFDPLKWLRWRNSDLDFSSLDALAESLDRPPDRPGLIKVRDALDDRSLHLLAGREEVRERCTDEAGVRLLWQVCQIPDFRKTLTEAHLHLLAIVFRHLTSDRGVLPNDWVGRMIAKLDRVDGDIDALVGRIAHIRTWTYLSHRADWLDDPQHWQERAREVEDRLSDALHERLTQKFIDRRTAALLKALRASGELQAHVEEGGEVVADGHLVGRLDGFSFSLAGSLAENDVDGERRLLAAAARRTVTRELTRIAGELVAENDAGFARDGDRLLWRGQVVGRILPAATPLHLEAEVIATDELGAKGRRAVEARLQRWLEAWLKRRIEPLLDLDSCLKGAGLTGAGRAIAYRLIERVGMLPTEQATSLVGDLTAADRKLLARHDVRFGVLHIYLPSLLKPAAVEALALLWSLGQGESLTPPTPGRTALRGEDLESGPAALAALGFVDFGRVALRVDIVERLAAQLRQTARQQETFPLPMALAAAAGISRDELVAIAPLLGFRSVERDGELHLKRRRRSAQRPGRAERKARAMRGPRAPAHSPFAVLAELKTGS